MARVKQFVPAPLVMVSVVLNRDELRGLDFMAREMRFDRADMIRRALDLVAVLGPEYAANSSVDGGLADVRCANCGARE